MIYMYENQGQGRPIKYQIGSNRNAIPVYAVPEEPKKPVVEYTPIVEETPVVESEPLYTEVLEEPTPVQSIPVNPPVVEEIVEEERYLPNGNEIKKYAHRCKGYRTLQSVLQRPVWLGSVSGLRWKCSSDRRTGLAGVSHLGILYSETN